MKAFTLKFVDNQPELWDGIETTIVNNEAVICIPKIQGTHPRKSKIYMAKENPARVINGIVHELYFSLMGGQKFSDEKSFVVAKKPKERNLKIAILAPCRWTELGIEHVHGRSNGFIPGVQILAHGESIRFEYKKRTYYIVNYGGDAMLTASRGKIQSAEEKNNWLRRVLLERSCVLA